MINVDNTEYINVFKICWMEKIPTTFGINIYFDGAPYVSWFFNSEEERNNKWNEIVTKINDQHKLPQMYAKPYANPNAVEYW